MRKLVLFPLMLMLMGADNSEGCNERDRAHQAIFEQAVDQAVYVPKNGLELKNYNRRGELADDPTTILWCTSSFPIPASPLFTVPMVGKLTSGSKRPFAGDSSTTMDSNGMFGPSGEYRFGFTPAGQYADWYNMATFCTTEPMVWQRQNTQIAMAADPRLLAAHQEARRLLGDGNAQGATDVLTRAIYEDSSQTGIPSTNGGK